MGIPLPLTVCALPVTAGGSGQRGPGPAVLCYAGSRAPARKAQTAHPGRRGQGPAACPLGGRAGPPAASSGCGGTCLRRPSSETAQCAPEGPGRPAGVPSVSAESQIGHKPACCQPGGLGTKAVCGEVCVLENQWLESTALLLSYLHRILCPVSHKLCHNLARVPESRSV